LPQDLADFERGKASWGHGVDDSYELPFKFTVTIDKLSYKLGREQLTAEEQTTKQQAVAAARDTPAH